MRRIKLYPTPPRLAVELAAPRQVAQDCNRCAQSDGRKRVLMPEVFEAPGPKLLVVGDRPGRAEDMEGRPFVGTASAKLRPLVRRWWDGGIVLDSGIRCLGKSETTDRDVLACRGHLAETLKEVRPDRVLLLGAEAALSFVGRRVQPLNARKTYTWLWNDGNPVPVFFLLNPRDCGHNRFLWRYFEEDLKWALKATVQEPWHLSAEASVVETPEDGATAAAALREADSFAFDLEYAGSKWGPDFKLLDLSAAPVGGREVFVWGEKALLDAAVFAPLRALLEDPAAPKGGANVKVDQAALKSALGVVVQGVAFDVRLKRKLMDPEATGNLADMAELVGMGGHKREADEALDAVCQRIAVAVARQEKDAAAQTGAFSFLSEIDTEEWQGFDVAKYVDRPKAIAFAFLEPGLRQRYAARDALSTARIESRLSLDVVRSPERQAVLDGVVMPAAVAIQRVEEWGVPYDAQAGILFGDMARQARDEAYEKVQQYALGGSVLNVDSPPQLARVLYDELGLNPPLKTEGGAPSTGEEALSILRGQHPLPGYILEYRHHQKLLGYSEDWPRYVDSDGRIRPSIHLDGARSGRTSCLAQWSEVLTSTGLKPISSVLPGDLVWTHRGRWRRVTARIRQGVRDVVDVFLAGGYILTCTSDHKVLTSEGSWRPIEELARERWDEVGVGRSESAGGPCSVPQLRAAELYGDCQEAGDDDPERLLGLEAPTLGRRKAGAEVGALLGIEAREPESNVGEEGGGAPQLDWPMRRRVRVLDVHVEGQAEVRPPRRTDGSSGVGGAPGLGDRPPHRREQEAQRAGEPRAGDGRRSPADPLPPGQGLSLSEIEEVLDRGSLEVFDLTVEEDESFQACGVFVHNCSNPNLQNLPRADDADGKRARDCFRAPHGKVLVQLDYSQLELRIAALLSQDDVMADLFKSGVDFHLGTAKLICKLAWNIEPEQVTKVHRTGAKAFNFGIAYGKTDRSLAAELGIDEARASAIRAAIFGKFVKYGQWTREAVAFARAAGGCWTIWEGRKARWRPLWRIGDDSDEGRHAASNARNGAINSPIQGTSSDFCVASIARVVSRIEAGDIDAELVLPIHDSIMLVAPKKTWKEAALAARHEMLNFPWATDFVPLEVDVEMGASWGSLEKAKL